MAIRRKFRGVSSVVGNSGQQASRYAAGLDASNQRYQSMLDAFKQAQGQYADIRTMYAPGGDYETGLNTIAREEATKGLGNTQARSVLSGVNTAAGAANASRGFARDVATAYGKTRSDALGFQANAMAGAASTYQALAQMLTSWRPPSMGDFASQEELQQGKQVSGFRTASPNPSGDMLKEPDSFSPNSAYNQTHGATGGFTG